MDLMVANPAGFWMLLGVPAVLAIHFLQNRSPRLPVSTLFLLDRLSEDEHRGSAFDRLRHSAALWLQLLAVLLLTLLLVRPMPLRHDSAQAVAIVLDNSYSMQAFTAAIRQEVTAETRRLSARAMTTEWFLQTTDPARPSLYTGLDREALLTALETWIPDSAEHDHGAALRRAAELAGSGGLTLLVTDHIPDTVPPGVALLAVGKPLDNVGFGSLAVQAKPDGTHQWRAALINHSDTPQRRDITVTHEAGTAAPEAMALTPGQIRILRGEIPAGARRMTLALSPPDSFSLDDTLSILPTRRRVLPATLALVDENLIDWAKRVMAAAPAVTMQTGATNASLVWIQSDHFAAPSATTPATNDDIIHRIRLGANLATNALVRGRIVAESHPLTRDLSWNGLLCSVLPGAPIEPGDEPLLWMAGHPLIVLRHHNGGARELQLRFDINASNAERHPAIILLLHRYMERVRRTLPGDETGIVELNQRLELPALRERGGVEYARGMAQSVTNVTRIPAMAPVHAPATPGFFQLRQNGQVIFTGSAVFTETREANFRGAASRNDLDSHTPEKIRIHRRDDRLAPLWLVLLGVTILASWYATLKSNPRVS